MNADFSGMWLNLLRIILDNGVEVSPRGKKTKELMQRTLQVDMRKPVLTVPERKLNYKFMAAEAYWILSGDDRVETIAPFNPRISEFSDDGVKFFGAYGPKIKDQLPYVLEKLTSDHDTRQAGLTIWRENPPATKDVPCTVAIFFNLRPSHYAPYLVLNANVFMRSSDAWLGVPYDVFNFCMLGHYVCACLNDHAGKIMVSPGMLYLTAASSHLYETNWEAAEQCRMVGQWLTQPDTPEELWTRPGALMRRLEYLRTSKPGDVLRWWDVTGVNII